MCFWFKKKNNLIPSDAEKGFMTSNFLSIKLGEKLSLPENIICYVTYKDKTYYELSHGNYNLTRELLIDLYQKQYKVEAKANTLDVDLFFVNTNPLSKEIVLSDKISVRNTIVKGFFRVYFTLKVTDPKTFSKYIRAEFAYVSAKDTDKYIFDDIELFTKQFFLRKNFDNFKIPTDMFEDYQKKLSKKLLSVGLTLSNLKLEIDTTKDKQKRSEFDFFSDEIGGEFAPSNNINQPETKEVELVEKTNFVEENNTELPQIKEENTLASKPVNSNICPVCKSKRIQNSLYCIRCGNKFN